MKAKEAVLRAIIRRRGYLVLVQANWHSVFPIGYLVGRAGNLDLGKPLKVLAKTSARDFLTQQQLSRRLEPAHWKGISATAQLEKYKEQGGPLKFWKVKPTRRRFVEG